MSLEITSEEIMNPESLIYLNFSSSYHGFFSLSDFKNLCNHLKNGNIIKEGHLTETPDKIKKTLKIHQKRILSEMIKKENSPERVSSGINMCVLADKVGSGKSIDILSLIANKTHFDTLNPISNKLKYPMKHESHYFTGFKIEETSVVLKTNLIVVPHGIYNQWVNYISNDTSLTFYGISNRKLLNQLNINDLVDGKYDIVLVKSTRFNEFMDDVYLKFPFTIETTDDRNIKEFKKLIDNNHIFRDLMSFFWYNHHQGQDAMKRVEQLKILKTLLNELDFETITKKIERKGQFRPVKIEHYNGPVFERVIIDEADSINIPKCSSAYGKFNWFMTSSIETFLKKGIRRQGFIKEIVNKNNYYRYFIKYMQELYLKNFNDFVDESFNLPDPVFNYINCFTPPELKILKGVALPQVIEALNAGDVNSAISLSGCSVTSSTNIVDLVLNKLVDKHEKVAGKIELYEIQLSNLLDDLNNKKDQLKENINILNNITHEDSEIINNINKLKDDEIPKIKVKIQSKRESIKNYKNILEETIKKIECIKNRITNISEKICAICTDTIECPTLTPCCKNYFCLECITTSLSFKKMCPLCRKHLELKDMIIIQEKDSDDDSSITEDEPTLPKKEEVLINMINSKPDGRFLVFSSFDNSFNTVSKLLNDNHIPWSKLCGSSGRVNNIIKQFTDNKIRVLLLNAKYYGSGLNLQMTTDIVLYHRMNSDLEKQIIGRGQRVGRTSPLIVNYLCYENEV